MVHTTPKKKMRPIILNSPKVTRKRKRSGEVTWAQANRYLQSSPSTGHLRTQSSYNTPGWSTPGTIAATGAGFIGGMWGGAAVAAPLTLGIPVVGEVIGAAAAAAGGAWGAVTAFNATRGKKVSLMKTHNSLVNKSVVAKVGKVKQAKSKTVKVSPYLKKAIKQVAAGATASGEYVRHFNGMVGTWIASIDTIQTGTTMGFFGTTAISPAETRPAGSWTWFNNLYTYRQGLVPTILPAAELNFFTPGKILHAASVLWNLKPENVNPYLPTGNMGTSFVKATGAQIQAEQGNLKIHVTQSYARFLIKNLSSRPAEVLMYELVPKKKFVTQSPLTGLTEAFTDVTDSTDNKQFAYYYNGAPSQGGPHLDGNFDPLPYVGKEFQWSHSKKLMLLAPNEAVTVNVAGPTGIMDYSKLFNDGNYVTTGMYKDWGKSVLFAVRPQPSLRVGTAAVTNGERTAFYAAGTGALGMPIAIEVTEVLRLKVPEIAGFAAAAGGVPGAGNPQTLNLRKHRVGYTTFVGTNSLSEPLNNVVAVSSEDDPLNRVFTQGSI